MCIFFTLHLRQGTRSPFTSSFKALFWGLVTSRQNVFTGLFLHGFPQLLPLINTFNEKTHGMRALGTICNYFFAITRDGKFVTQKLWPCLIRVQCSSCRRGKDTFVFALKKTSHNQQSRRTSTCASSLPPILVTVFCSMREVTMSTNDA